MSVCGYTKKINRFLTYLFIFFLVSLQKIKKKMNITKTLILSIFFLSFLSCNRQTKSNSEDKNSFESNVVSLSEKEETDYINPYYNGHWKHFNLEKIDLSKDYLELRSKWFLEKENIISQYIKYDFSSVWLTDNTEQNGVIGKNYQRIQVHFSKITRSNDDFSVYLVEGKSKVNNNICSFKGEIKLMKLLAYEGCENDDFDKCCSLFASYKFYEDSTENHSGIFTGVVESIVYIDDAKKEVLLDEASLGADGYWNNTFVGIWTNYKNKQSKKCIWGDYRLPFSFEFDCGDGEMRICDEYVKNGWQTFNDMSEYIQADEYKWELKNKWWK